MKPHRMDGVSLSFGLIFVAITLWWGLYQVATIHLPNAGWLIAGALIFFGVVGLLGAIRSNRREQPVHATSTTQAPAPPAVDLPDNVTPEMHAKIVQELLHEPAGPWQPERPAQGERPAQ